MNKDAYLNMKKQRRRSVFKALLKNKVAVICGVFLILLILMAVFADVFMDYDTQALGMSKDIMQPPSAEHWFGTDITGRDIFARIVFGARYSLSMGLLVTAIVIVLCFIFGALAAYYGGWVDNVIMRVSDVLLCIPGILLTLAIIAALGTSFINLILGISIASVPSGTKVARAIILNVRNNEYIEAARANGMSDGKIIRYHILPNVLGPILVEGTMMIAGMIISTASLSYLGLGIQPPTPEWGSMLSDVTGAMRNHPHLAIFPGLAIVMTSLSFNLLGDGLRDALDPLLKD